MMAHLYTEATATPAIDFPAIIVFRMTHRASRGSLEQRNLQGYSKRHICTCICIENDLWNLYHIYVKKKY